jgi:hypothetical protein
MHPRTNISTYQLAQAEHHISTDGEPQQLSYSSVAETGLPKRRLLAVIASSSNNYDSSPRADCSSTEALKTTGNMAGLRSASKVPETWNGHVVRSGAKGDKSTGIPTTGSTSCGGGDDVYGTMGISTDSVDRRPAVEDAKSKMVE